MICEKTLKLHKTHTVWSQGITSLGVLNVLNKVNVSKCEVKKSVLYECFSKVEVLNCLEVLVSLFYRYNEKCRENRTNSKIIMSHKAYCLYRVIQ